MFWDVTVLSSSSRETGTQSADFSAMYICNIDHETIHFHPEGAFLIPGVITIF